MNIENYILNVSKTNLPERGCGIIALMANDTDQFCFVTPGTFNAVNNGENNEYSLNYVLFSIEDRDWKVKDNQIVTRGELPRTSISVSTIFYDKDSLMAILDEGTAYFKAV